MNILFICTGNTCRSPMAEGIMNKIAIENDLDIHAYSAGLYAADGTPASEEAVTAAKKINVDISSHKSHILTRELIEQSDLILTMTEAHKQMLQFTSADNVYTIKEYAGYSGDIQDPFGGDQYEYDEVCQELYDDLVDIAERLYDEYFSKDENSDGDDK